MAIDREIRFRYAKRVGESAEYCLAPGWREVGRYLEGIDTVSARFKTFRKDRVVLYLDSADLRLNDPFPEPPLAPRKKCAQDLRAQILFTGFASIQRSVLERKADAGGLHVVKTVTVGLTFLCGGPNAGPSKVAAAREQNVFIVSEAQFHQLIDTGELPDDDDDVL